MVDFKSTSIPNESPVSERMTSTDSFGVSEPKDSFEPSPVSPRSPLFTPTTTHSQDPPFEGEFPNYFHTNDTVKAARIQAKVNQAMASILRRLDLPYVDKTGNISRTGFFAALEAHIQAQDPGAKVHISGGVVRSLLGYIYKKVYNEHQRESTPETTEAVLDRIIAGASRKPLQGPLDEQGRMSKERDENDRRLLDQELPKLTALGIGSDLDVSVEFSPNCRNKDEIKASTARFIDSAIDQMMPDADKRSVFNRSLLPIGDAVDYEAQLKRSMNQGGSPLDWLVFPATPHSGTVIREGVPGTLQQFWAGQVQYVSPENADNRDVQVIRMLRPLLEMPFLHPSPETVLMLENELNTLVEKLRAGGQLSQRAQKEFDKMMRNARFEGARNRFAGREESSIARLVREISEVATKGEKGMPLVPEYIRTQRIDRRQVSNHELDQYLTPPTDFIRDGTSNGFLHHGTPKMEYVLTMMRNGLMPSIPGKQGTAAYGAGVYTAKDYEISQEYARTLEGVVLELPVNRSPNLRVLDLRRFKAKDKKLFEELGAEAKRSGRDLNQYLAEKYQLDIIVHEHTLIMNRDAVRVPKNASDLIKAKLSLSPVALLLASPETLSDIEHYYQLGLLLNVRDISKPVLDEHSLTDILTSNQDPAVLNQALLRLRELGSLSPKTFRNICNCLANPDPSVQKTALDVLGFIGTTDPEIHDKIANSISIEYPDVCASALGFFAMNKPSNPGIRGKIEEVLNHVVIDEQEDLEDEDIFNIQDTRKNQNRQLRQQAFEALATPETTDPKVQAAIANFLRSNNATVRTEALDCLGRIKNIDPSIHPKIIECLRDQDPGTRKAALSALGEIGLNSPGLQAAIIGCLEDSDLSVCLKAIETIEKLKISTPQVISRLKSYIQGKDTSREAIEALKASALTQDEWGNTVNNLSNENKLFIAAAETLQELEIP